MTTYDVPTSTSPTDQTNDPRDLDVLPPLGEGTKEENWAKINAYWDALAQGHVDFYSAPCDQADQNLVVFETGKSTAVDPRDVISNKIRKDITSKMSDLLRDPPTRTVEPAEHGDPPDMVPIGDPMTGMPAIDPQTMMPAMFPVDDNVKADFETFICDYFWDKAELDSDIESIAFNASIAGWYIALFEEDRQAMLPRIRTNLSVRQVMLDPSVGPFKAVETANDGMLRWRVNWWQGRAMYPHLAKHLDQKASDGEATGGSIIPLGANERNQTTGEKKVDVEFLFLRNYPVQKMTPEEALAYGEIEQRQIPAAVPGAESGLDEIEAGSQAGAPAEQPADGGVDELGDVREGEAASAGGSPSPENGLGLSADGAVRSLPPRVAYFLPNSQTPITPASPEWPWWLGTRRLARVEKCIGEDTISECYDGIPFIYMPGNISPMTACGQGDPDTGCKLQEGFNRALTNGVEHADVLAHPVKVFCASAWKELPERYKQEGASIAGLSVVIDDEIYKALGGKISVYDEAPPMSAALGQIMEILEAQQDQQSPSPKVSQGLDTPGTTTALGTQILQQQAAGRLDLPAKFIEKAVRRTMNLLRWWWLWRVPIAKLQQIASHLPPEVVEHCVLSGRETDRNIKVQVNISTGGVQARKANEAVQKFNTVDPASGERLIGMETLRDRTGEDNAVETQRQAPLLQALQVMQQMQQQAQAMKQGGGEQSAPTQGPPA